MSEHFFSRWSQRKQAVAKGLPVAEPVAPASPTELPGVPGSSELQQRSKASPPSQAAAQADSQSSETPAQPLPAGSAEIARHLGHTGAHMELRQACTGFANALQIAFAMTAQPDAAPVGIVGVETGSVFFDPLCLHAGSAQWVNFLQMGDGAAAVVIAPDDAQASQPRITAAFFGQCQQPPPPGLQLRQGGSDHSACAAGVLHFTHDYRAVMQHGLYLLEQGRDALAQAGHALADARWVVPHQASGALAPWLAAHWQLPRQRVSAHGAQVGNLGSASIWAALDHLLGDAPPRGPGRALFLGAEATQYSHGGFVLELP